MKQIIISFAITVILVSGCISTTRTNSVVSTPQPTTNSGTMTTSSLSCNNYQTQANQARQDLVKLGELFTTLKKRNCSADDLEQLERNMSNLAATKASNLVQSGNLDEAENWLKYKYTPVNLWITQSVRGDIAAQRKQWQEAALFYNQALDLMADPKATPEQPPHSEIQKVYNLAIEAQLLAENMVVATTKSYGSPSSGTMRDNIGSFKITKRPIPIKFNPGKSTLTSAGKNSAKQMAAYLKRKEPQHVTLVGHTDPKGTDKANCRLSIKRASSLKNYLVNDLGVNFEIETIGKGERELYMSYGVSRYSKKEIDKLNRRVEFFTDPSYVSRDKEC